MDRLYSIADDFEATIRIFAEAEGGGKTSAFNGIRWDFSYADATDQLCMIWPDFSSPSGDGLPKDQPLPFSTELSARMTIVIDEMREQVHRNRIKPGVEFYCHEGPKRMAIGRVTRITGLYNDRQVSSALFRK
ncbi:MAG: hypothetical protein LBS40_00530 [Burkholderiales bacterium]|nr:hypothetical protein [Burkholderiales bacterium]